MSGCPASSAAPRRFSVSAVFSPVDITGMGCPLETAAMTSPRKLLPEPGVVARLACIGVTENAPRTTGVISADKATARATLSTNGKPFRRSSSSFSASSAPCLVGQSGIAGSGGGSASNNRVARSYPGSVSNDPSGRMVGVR